MYDPATARFHARDPLAQEFYFQSAYAYAANNPIRYIDYKGLWFHDPTLKAQKENQSEESAKNETSTSGFVGAYGMMNYVGAANTTHMYTIIFNGGGSNEGSRSAVDMSRFDTEMKMLEKKQMEEYQDPPDEGEEAANSGGKPWHYTSDYTENGLVLSQSNGRYSYGAWQEDKTGTFLAGAGSGMAIWYLTSGWGLTAAGEALIAGTSGGLGLANLRYETRRVGYIVDQTTWYGTITHNVFTGNIVGVNNTGLVTNQVNLPNYGMYQERIIFTPTNTVIGTRSKSFGSWQGVSQPAPSVGGNLYGW